MRLSNTAIRNAKAGEKTRRLFDGGGLYLAELRVSGEVIPLFSRVAND